MRAWLHPLQFRQTAADTWGVSLTEAFAASGIRVQGLSAVLVLTILMGSLWMWALCTERTRYQRARRARAIAAAEANHAIPDPNAGRAKPLELAIMAAIWLGVIAYEIGLIVPLWGWTR